MKKVLFLIALSVCTSIFAADEKNEEYKSIKQLKSAGFLKCSGRTQDAIKQMYEEENFGYSTIFNNKNPDKRAATMLIAKSYSEAHSVTSISATPSLSNGCDVVVTHIIPMPESCVKAREDVFSETKFSGEIDGVPLYEGKNDKSFTLLLNQIKGTCIVVISRTISFD